jgi:hypothetical protein
MGFFRDEDEADEAEDAAAETAMVRRAPALAPVVYAPAYAPQPMATASASAAGIGGAMKDELGRGIVRGMFKVGPGLLVGGALLFVGFRAARRFVDWLSEKGIRVVRVQKRDEADADGYYRRPMAGSLGGPRKSARQVIDVDYVEGEPVESEADAKARKAKEKAEQDAEKKRAERMRERAYGVTVDVLGAMIGATNAMSLGDEEEEEEGEEEEEEEEDEEEVAEEEDDPDADLDEEEEEEEPRPKKQAPLSAKDKAENKRAGGMKAKTKARARNAKASQAAKQSAKRTMGPRSRAKR